MFHPNTLLMTVSDLSFGPLPSFPETIFHRLIAARGKFLIPPQISGTHLGNYLLSLQASCQFYNHFQCCHVLYSNRLLIIFSTGSTFYTFCIYRMSGPHILSSIHFNAKEKNTQPVCLRYIKLFSSTGKNPIVAPYSGHMLAMVALSAMER